MDGAPSAFNAQIEFEFEPRGVALPATGAAGATKIVEAAGQITQALLSHVMVASLPDERTGV